MSPAGGARRARPPFGRDVVHLAQGRAAPEDDPNPTTYAATDEVAIDVLEGRCDHLLPEGGVPTTRRWFTGLHRDDRLDIWLCSWVPGDPTGLHDHSASLGALTVVSGSLEEHYWDGARLRYRRLDEGDQAGFPLGWIHDVVCGQPRIKRPPRDTLSVHAYSPPLTTMTRYEITGNRLLRQEAVDGS